MNPTRPTVSDVISRASRSLRDTGLRLVITWRDLECGCCVSDPGSWIVTTSCPVHVALIPDDRAGAWPLKATGIDYGPFVPARPARPHAAGEGLLRPDLAASTLTTSDRGGDTCPC